MRCECGGSVSLDFGGLLRPYQRIWHDVEAQIQRWGALAVSLRQMRNELANTHIGPLALRTLNRRLLQLVDLTPLSNLVAVPPILQIDAIWITVLRPTGKVRRDRKGRKRAVKGRFKCPVVSQTTGRRLARSPGKGILVLALTRLLSRLYG